MQREYECFCAVQDRNRKAFAEQQRVEQERFLAYQKRQTAKFERFGNVSYLFSNSTSMRVRECGTLT